MRRQNYAQGLDKMFSVFPIVALLGPRQCGKTTLAKQFATKHPQVTYFDLENQEDLIRLENNAQHLLGGLTGLIVIDEIQRRPELFPILRVLVDRKQPQQFLILGSASRELIRQSSESLAGRIGYMELSPFGLDEVDDQQKLWVRGGFPLSYLADAEDKSVLWRQQYVRTFLEQDIPALGIRVASQDLRRFWMMLAHYHAGIFNASEMGRSLMVDYKTVQRYLDILTGTFMVRRLNPWYENISKRQVKSPKLYFRDSGLLHTLLNVNTHDELLHHPKLGLSWEGFALESLIRVMDVSPEECYFWASQSGAELDLLVFKGGKRLGFEFKFQDAPRTTKSMHVACEDLTLDKLTVIYPGNTRYALNDKIEAVPLIQAITSL